MTAQSPPYALQNSSSHSAALFRQAAFSPWLGGGIVAPGEYAVTAQGTPNMSVVVAGGRAWIAGTQVANVSGQAFSTQAGYFGLNDAPATVTIATANATNPRIDLVYVAVQDAFYSGATNALVVGVVTGTPAPSPSAPAAPSNALALATVAVAANATSITNGNISQTPTASLLAVTRGGIDLVLSTDVTAGLYTGQYRDHPTNGLERWNATDSAWESATPIGEWTTIGTNGTYSYTLTTSGGTVLPAIGASSTVTVTIPKGRQLEVELAIPKVNCGPAAAAVVRLVDTTTGTVLDGFEVSTSAGVTVWTGQRLRGVVVGDGTAHTIAPQGWNVAASTTATVGASTDASAPVFWRYRIV